jgi:uncharacterized membrane protein YecN with MAPEG domain
MIRIPVTLFTSGVLGILCAVLSLMVSMARNKAKVMIGDGAGSAGAEDLFRSIRAHGNFVEYVPLALILLGGVEFSGASRLTCEIFAVLLIVARLMHAMGITKGPLAFRAGGSIITLVVLLGLGIEALRLSI